jgi:hypothetical protein
MNNLNSFQNFSSERNEALRQGGSFRIKYTKTESEKAIVDFDLILADSEKNSKRKLDLDDKEIQGISNKRPRIYNLGNVPSVGKGILPYSHQRLQEDIGIVRSDEVCKKTEEGLNKALAWLDELFNILKENDHADSLVVIEFLFFINTRNGFDEIIASQKKGASYIHGEGDPLFESLNKCIYFHYKDTKMETAKALSSLLAQYVTSLEYLKTQEEKIQFFSLQQDLCIEAKTSEAFIYAASLASSSSLNNKAPLQPFYTVMEKYEKEAREALIDIKYTPRILAQYIVEKHDGEQCIGQLPFLEGVITAQTALAYLLFSNAGDHEDTILI